MNKKSHVLNCLPALVGIGATLLGSVSGYCAGEARTSFEITGTAVENCTTPYHPDESTVIEAEYDALQQARSHCESGQVFFITDLKIDAHCSGPWMALQFVHATGVFSCR